jgi:hypothetical protein
MTKENLLPNNSISINIKKHNVVVIDETIVHINHVRACKNPCIWTQDIVDYLEAEMFVKEGYIVSDINIREN